MILLEAGAPDELTTRWGRWENIQTVRRYRLAYQTGKLHNHYAPVQWVRQKGEASQE